MCVYIYVYVYIYIYIHIPSQGGGLPPDEARSPKLTRDSSSCRFITRKLSQSKFHMTTFGF